MASLATLAAVATPVAHAHAQGAPDAGRERTGPNAQPPPLPSFAIPKTQLPLAPPAAPTAGPSLGEAVLFSDVHIDEANRPLLARPARAWRPTVNASDGLELSYRRGETLDGAWVRRQFAWNHLIGVETSPDRVTELVLLINRAFAQNGYLNSGLLFSRQEWPARGAVLDLRLVSGRVVPRAPGGAAVAVAFANGRSKGLTAGYIRQRMPAAARRPLDAIAVERDFRLLADDPAVRTLNAQLTPGPEAGEATLAVTVDPQPRLDLYGSLANSRSPSVGGERAAIGASIRNALFAGDVLGGEYGVTSGLSDGTVDYSTPFFSPRLSLDARFAFDDAAVIDENLRALDIKSEESSYEVGLSDRLLDTPLTPDPSGGGWIPARSLTAGLHFERRLSTSTLLGRPFSFSPGAVNGHTRLSVLRGTIDWVERGERQVIAASATGSLGLQGTRSDIPGVPTPDPNFKTILVELNYARRLGGGGLEFRARAAGQWASGLLYSQERFSVGGENSVRGYRENLLLADSGALGSIELSCPVGVAPGLCTGRSDDWRTVRVSVFTDGAVVRNQIDPQPVPNVIGSVGVGVTWAPSNGFSARLTIAQPLVKAPVLGTPDLQDNGVAFELTVHPLALFARRKG